MNEQKTLRDEFASDAMKAIISSPKDYTSCADSSAPMMTWPEIAKGAYQMADAMLAERAKNAPKADADGWIEWGGGECPVAESRIVEVKYRDGDKGTAAAYELWWTHSLGSSDIIAYRIKVIK